MKNKLKYLQLKLMLAKNEVKTRIISLLEFLSISMSIISICLLIYEFGFKVETNFQYVFIHIYLFSLFVFFIIININIGNLKYWKTNIWRAIFNLGSYILLLLVLSSSLLFKNFITHHLPFLLVFNNLILIYLLTFFYSIFKVSTITFELIKKKINPSILFTVSFLLFVLVGTGLLMMPRATTVPISLVDALFTSTSAVCVTGLTVVDTASAFTPLGKLIIIILIQIGGIGIMTFTSFFGLFFMGKRSFENQIVIKDLINEDHLGEIFTTLKNIILITFFIELIGAYLIFMSMNGQTKNDFFLSSFHSVSAFCNAGFSTFSANLYDVSIRHNYFLQTTIAFLIIIGGIGFPIIFNLTKILNHYLRNLFNMVIGVQKTYKHVPRIINVHTTLVVKTTFILLIAGTALFFITEHNHVLMQHLSLKGKIATAFFMSVTPRTAGFNTFDMNLLSTTSILIMMFLMWIGASPGSTGGGIKTSTLALAFLNIVNTIKGKERIEINYRRIANISVQRAFAVIFMSIIILFIGIVLVAFFEPQASLKQVAFECFSALGTVGLSLNFTATTCTETRLVIICLMFIGRVGMIAILTNFLRPAETLRYSFPKENILIN